MQRASSDKDGGRNVSAKTKRLSEDLNQFLNDHESAAVVAVRTGAADDIASSVVALARRAAAAGRPVRLLAPDGPSAVRWRAAFDREGLDADGVRSVREAALAVISGAGEAFPRQARMLDGNEMDVLMEDLKVSGLKAGRLREMTKFFYKGIADGVSDDPDWLISAEEQRIWTMLVENLEARRALLPVEANALALKALETPGGFERSRELMAAGALLVVPAYSTLSATGQQLVRALKPETLVAFGTDLDAGNAEEDYPNPTGFAALLEEAGENGACFVGTDEAVAETLACAHPAEEFDEVARLVAEAVATGADPAAITVACPHRLWMEGIAKRLAERGVPCVIDTETRKVKGDPREEERCGRLRTRAAAKLLVDETDFTAWRSWLGLGDWLLRSDAFAEFLAYAHEQDMTAADAFDQLASLPDGKRNCPLFAKFEEPAARFAALRDGLAAATGAEAAELFERAGCTLTDSERAVLADTDAFDREAFAALVLADPVADATDAVAIVPYRRAFGRHGDLAVVCGLVNGFLPPRDALSDSETIDHKRRAYDRGRILFEAAKSAGADRIVCTYFTDDRIENADALDMDVARIYVKGGLHFATLTPSSYLTDNTPVPPLPTVETTVGGMATTL